MARTLANLSGRLARLDRGTAADTLDAVDVLGDVLTTTRFGGGIRCRSELGAPWAIEFPPGRVGFHFLIRGAAWLSVPQAVPRQILPGDVLLLPHGGAHILADEPASTAVPLQDLLAADDGGEVPRLTIGGPGPRSTLICGAFRSDHDGPHPLLALLPPVLHLTAEQVAQDAGLRSTLTLLGGETGVRLPGGSTVVARLVDVLFVYVVRRWLAGQPPDATGWLTALGDPAVGAALAAIHADPARRWTVAALAATVGMSRAAFARRFVDLVGEPPLAYVRRRRIDRAALLLRETRATLRQVAGRVGYDSEYAFSKAFGRVHGQSPGRYRSAAEQGAT